MEALKQVFHQTSGPIFDYIDHEVLKRAYPEIARTKIEFLIDPDDNLKNGFILR